MWDAETADVQQRLKHMADSLFCFLFFSNCILRMTFLIVSPICVCTFQWLNTCFFLCGTCACLTTVLAQPNPYQIKAHSSKRWDRSSRGLDLSLLVPSSAGGSRGSAGETLGGGEGLLLGFNASAGNLRRSYVVTATPSETLCCYLRCNLTCTSGFVCCYWVSFNLCDFRSRYRRVVSWGKLMQ